MLERRLGVRPFRLRHQRARLSHMCLRHGRRLSDGRAIRVDRPLEIPQREQGAAKDHERVWVGWSKLQTLPNFHKSTGMVACSSQRFSACKSGSSLLRLGSRRRIAVVATFSQLTLSDSCTGEMVERQGVARAKLQRVTVRASRARQIADRVEFGAECHEHVRLLRVGFERCT